MLAYADLASFTTATNGMVNAITLDASKTFVEVGHLKYSAETKETLSKSLENGTAFYTQTLSLGLADMTVENQTFVKSVLNQPVVALIKTKSGNYFAYGLNGQLDLSGLEGGTGIKEEDKAGYTLTFTGIDTKLAPKVDSTIVAALLA